MNVQKLLKEFCKKGHSALTGTLEKEYNKFIKFIRIERNGVLQMYLNPRLILKQGIGEKEVRTLRRLHLKRIKMFEEMKKLKSKKSLLPYVEKLEKLEFAMQKAWGFTQDVKFHSWWNRAPHCTCPRIDNDDMFGTGLRIISSDCILHHKPVEKDKDSGYCKKCGDQLINKECPHCITKKPVVKEECKKCKSFTGKAGHQYYKCMVPGTCPAISEKKNK